MAILYEGAKFVKQLIVFVRLPQLLQVNGAFSCPGLYQDLPRLLFWLTVCDQLAGIRRLLFFENERQTFRLPSCPRLGYTHKHLLSCVADSPAGRSKVHTAIPSPARAKRLQVLDDAIRRQLQWLLMLVAPLLLRRMQKQYSYIVCIGNNVIFLGTPEGVFEGC